MRKQSLVLALGLAVVGAVAPLHAQIGVPCTLPPDSYGGTGIPTDHSYCGSGLGDATLALSSTARWFSAPVTTDAAGTYFANTGYSTGAPGGDVGFAAWNFDYFIGGTPAGAGRLFVLSAAGDASTGFGSHEFTFSGDTHDSTNGGYFPGFDPFAGGVYTFDLAEYTDVTRATLVNEVEIKVNVTATPEPASLALMSTGLLGLGAFVRRRKQSAK